MLLPNLPPFRTQGIQQIGGSARFARSLRSRTGSAPLRPKKKALRSLLLLRCRLRPLSANAAACRAIIGSACTAIKSQKWSTPQSRKPNPLPSSLKKKLILHFFSVAGGRRVGRCFVGYVGQGRPPHFPILWPLT